MLQNTPRFPKFETDKWPFSDLFWPFFSGIGHRTDIQANRNFFETQNIIKELPYTDLPDFPQPTVKGHAGKLVLGNIADKKVVCMYGRSHIYEGHEPNSLAKPIRVLKDIGCKLLIVTNAAGSLDEKMPAGSLMAISDHINLGGGYLIGVKKVTSYKKCGTLPSPFLWLTEIFLRRHGYNITKSPPPKLR